MSSITPVNAYQTLASSLMKTVDANHDGQLTLSEFSSFLQRMLEAPSPTLPTTASRVVGNSATTGRTPVDSMREFGSPQKLADLSHQTLKYRVGRVLQYYPHTPEGLRAALPELQEIVPGLTIASGKGDKLDFGDYVDPKSGRIGVVDVIRAAGAGGQAWQWLPVG